MNFLELCNNAKRESGRSGGNLADVTLATGDDLRIVNWVAEAWVELQRRAHGWNFMRRDMTLVIAPGDRSYTFAAASPAVTDFGRWLSEAELYYKPCLTLASGQQSFLNFKVWEDFKRSFELLTHAPAHPQYWSVGPDRTLYIGPTPIEAGTLKVEYYRAINRLALDDDEPLDLPEEFHPIIYWRALMELGSFDAAPEVYARGNMNFENADTDLRQQYAPRISFRSVSL